MRFLVLAFFSFWLTACGGWSTPKNPSLNPSEEKAATVFPHSENWSEPEEHGVWVVDNSDQLCLKCHGSTDAFISCKSCHELFPHASGWGGSGGHGSWVLQKGSTGCATNCHGKDLRGGQSNVSCYQCHADFPHPENFRENHGETLIRSKPLSTRMEPCKLCHGADFSGGSTGVSCYSCHKNFPHAATNRSEGPSPWLAEHGNYFINEERANSPTCATEYCHGSDLHGNNGNIADASVAEKLVKGCNDCHLQMPHQANWDHGKAAVTAEGLLDLAACSSCHGPDLQGDANAPSCSQCHSNYPAPHRNPTHEKNQNWTREGGHGETLLPAGSESTGLEAAQRGGCTTCHGADLKGGVSGKSCTSCHRSYPHEEEFATTHVNMMNGQPLAAQIEPCKLCHGANFNGGENAPSCFSCHQSFPHPAVGGEGENFAPWADKHGNYFLSKENKNSPSCASATCHGVDLRGNPPDVVAAEKIVKGCNDCHLQMPHQANWDHGKAAVTAEGLLDLAVCSSCHGPDLQGGENAPSCNRCHNNYPEPHRNAEHAANEAWTKNGGHGETLRTLFPEASGKEAAALAGCTTCHGDALDGGVTLKSCYNCHGTYPHTTPFISDGQPFGEWGGGAGHGTYVKTKAVLSNIQNVVVMECNNCHLNPPANSNAKTCTRCHDPQEQYPHPPGWHNAEDEFGGLHGQAVTRAQKPNSASNAGCLTACHGINGESGFVNTEFYCKSCHEKYPHLSANWKETEGLYPEHATEVLNTNNTETKNDDTFSEEKFAECSGCHGGQLTFDTDRYSLQPEELATLKEGEPQVDRCYACHRYPHSSVRVHNRWPGPPAEDNRVYNWGPLPGRYSAGHLHTLFYWNYFGARLNDPAIFTRQTCGEANGSSSCHSNGPISPNFRREDPYCTLCHPGRRQ